MRNFIVPSSQNRLISERGSFSMISLFGTTWALSPKRQKIARQKQTHCKRRQPPDRSPASERHFGGCARRGRGGSDGSGSLSVARGWGRPGRCRRDLTGATGCTRLLQRNADDRTAAVFCGCGARAIHGASRGKPRLRPFSLLSSTS